MSVNSFLLFTTTLQGCNSHPLNPLNPFFWDSLSLLPPFSSIRPLNPLFSFIKKIFFFSLKIWAIPCNFFTIDFRFRSNFSRAVVIWKIVNLNKCLRWSKPEGSKRAIWDTFHLLPIFFYRLYACFIIITNLIKKKFLQPYNAFSL